MADMLVRLYDLPSSAKRYRQTAKTGIVVRRAEAWDHPRLHSFVEKEFGALWTMEVDTAFTRVPPTAYVAMEGRKIVGFAVYECTRPNFFGPTGVRPDVRHKGVGAALLFKCLEAMREMGYAYAVIGGVGPAKYYEKVCGAFLIPGSESGIYAGHGALGG
jgi:GNAT superfamily N-acetyltransferase